MVNNIKVREQLTELNNLLIGIKTKDPKIWLKIAERLEIGLKYNPDQTLKKEYKNLSEPNKKAIDYLINYSFEKYLFYS